MSTNRTHQLLTEVGCLLFMSLLITMLPAACADESPTDDGTGDFLCDHHAEPRVQFCNCIFNCLTYKLVLGNDSRWTAHWGESTKNDIKCSNSSFSVKRGDGKIVSYDISSKKFEVNDTRGTSQVFYCDRGVLRPFLGKRHRRPPHVALIAPLTIWVAGIVAVCILAGVLDSCSCCGRRGQYELVP